jgi:HPt (histidine-containing phosphotransfer) domain-containing protein
MSDLPVVDSTQIEKLKEWGGVGLQRKMIDLFLTHATDRLDQIRDGLSSSDPDKAETGAHTLKSSAGNVGASRVQGLAQEAETLAEEGNLDGLQGLLPSLETEFKEACSALKEIAEGIQE